MPHDRDGKVVLLTGATNGVGRAAATEFVTRGARLTIVGRDEARTARVVAELGRSSSGGTVDWVVADLSTLAGMRDVVARFSTRHRRLDVLVNNAGAFSPGVSRTVDGVETTFALNYLAYFVVTVGLLGQLRDTPGARVVNTTSVAHRFGRVHVDRAADPTGRTGPSGGVAAYCDSKLATVVLTRELARRVGDADVAVNCFHPGFTRTGLFSASGRVGAVVRSPAAAWFARSPERATDTLLWLATSESARSLNGQYVVDRTVRRPGRRARHTGLGDELWRLSESLVQG